MRGPDLPTLTQNLVHKYISDSRTGAVICVINAFLPEVQNAPIFRILAGLSDELKSNCIGVFAKTDISFTPDHGCAKVQASVCVYPLYRTPFLTLVLLQNWLQQVIDPSGNRTFQTIADTFRAGCVALVNRDTNEQAVSICQQLGRESEFFLRKSRMHAFTTSSSLQPSDSYSEVDAQVTFNDLGRSCLGLPALISRIDMIIRYN
jgi:hypothetical protein